MDTFNLGLVFVLVLLNGCFVMAEYSLVAVRWTRVEELVERNVYGARAVQKAIENMEWTIAASQLGVTFCSLGVGWIGEPVLAELFHPLLLRMAVPWPNGMAHGFAIGIGFIIITYLHVVIGELAPKAIALQIAEPVALFFAGPLIVFGRVFSPLSYFMRTSGRGLVKLLRVPAATAEQSVHSSDEIDLLVEEGQEAGIIPHDEASYVRAVFELSDKKVRDILVPRDKVMALSLIATEDEILEMARETAHTRMPVYDGDLDNIVGIVNTKDLFHVFSLKGLVILMDAMYPALFVSPESAVSRLLKIFRKEKRQMAVVKAHDGAFLGIVTLEDILEEIVGEIEDEHD